jgi:hypothetical protein
MKETNNFAYVGDPTIQNKQGTFKTWSDELKTTMKETNNFAYVGDPTIQNKQGTFKTWSDQQKTTMKETNTFAYAGNPEQQSKIVTQNTWSDKPRSTIKQSTEYSYEGNPEKQDKQGRFKTWTDKPRSTIKQSTEFSYLGDPVSQNQRIESSRFQFTGLDSDGLENFENTDFNKINPNPFKDIKSLKKRSIKVGGADTYTIKGSTLVTDYMPGAGRSNIRQDPDYMIGKVDFGAYGLDETLQGPGTLSQALPDGSRMQNSRFMAVPHPSPNKLIGEDNRQIASYQIDALKQNPLSIYTTNPNGEVPKLFCDVEPDNFSALVNDRQKQLDEMAKSLNGPGSVEVYPRDGTPLNNNNLQNENPNMAIVYNSLGQTPLNDPNTENYNPMISQGSPNIPNTDPTFSGTCYSGSLPLGSQIQTSTDSNRPTVYEETKYRPKELGDMVPRNISEVQEPNRALDFTQDL